MIKSINLKKERISVENKINKCLSKRAIYFLRKTIFNCLLQAEMNDNGLDDMTPKEALHDSKCCAKMYQRIIAKNVDDIIEQIQTKISFHIMNEKIKNHYEIESLRAIIERQKKEIHNLNKISFGVNPVSETA